MSQGSKKTDPTRGDRSARKSLYGNPIQDKGAAVTKKTTRNLPAKNSAPKGAPSKVYGATVSSQPKFKPVSDEVTVYGAKKFRTPYRKDEFTGTQGSPIPAYVLDIDGTLQDWGSSADKDVMAWVKKIYDKDPNAVFLIVTARDHGSFGYESSFNWLMHNFPYPFIGPFARPKDDPRFASEFKRELAQGFEDMGLYQILGAADDNNFVIDMWKQWAKDHFTDPKDFDLFEASYSTYSSWRYDLPSKGYPSSRGSYGGYESYGSYGSHLDEVWDTDLKKYVKKVNSTEHPGERWVEGALVNGKWVKGYWAKVTDEAKHRPAGVSHWEKTDERPTPGHPVDLTNDPRWQHYFAARDKDGAYLGTERSDALDEVIGEIESRDRDADVRPELEDIVGHLYPGYTPADIEAMTSMDLREQAGVTLIEIPLTSEEREEFEAEVYAEYPSLTDAEIREIPDDELWSLYHAATVARDGYGDEAQALFNEHVNVYADSKAGKEREAKLDHRLNIEDEVKQAYPALSWTDIERLDLEVLEQMLADARAQADEPPAEQTLPLDVAEVLAEIDGSAKVSDLIEANLPPLGGGQVRGGSAAEGVA